MKLQQQAQEVTKPGRKVVIFLLRAVARNGQAGVSWRQREETMMTGFSIVVAACAVLLIWKVPATGELMWHTQSDIRIHAAGRVSCRVQNTGYTTICLCSVCFAPHFLWLQASGSWLQRQRQRQLQLRLAWPFAFCLFLLISAAFIRALWGDGRLEVESAVAKAHSWRLQWQANKSLYLRDEK